MAQTLKNVAILKSVLFSSKLVGLLCCNNKLRLLSLLTLLQGLTLNLKTPTVPVVVIDQSLPSLRQISFFPNLLASSSTSNILELLNCFTLQFKGSMGKRFLPQDLAEDVPV